jgi:hypothetical protein
MDAQRRSHSNAWQIGLYSSGSIDITLDSNSLGGAWQWMAVDTVM